MKIVQSFWSSGKALEKDGFGWHSSQFHIMSWALSALQLRKFYDDVQLYTDSNGHDVLIEYLQLPYTNISVCFDQINHYNEALWAMPKIITYAAQNHPFLHVDGDVFIWKPFTKRLKKAPLVAQNFERGTGYYKSMMTTLQKKLDYVPSFLGKALQKRSIGSFNAGILGGCDTAFYKSYATQAMEMIHNNFEAGSGKDISTNFNILFEQVLFCSMVKMNKKKVVCHYRKAFKDNGYVKEIFADLLSTSYRDKYAHLIGPHKRNKDTCELIGRILLKDYPGYFFKIIYMFRDQHARFNSHIHTLLLHVLPGQEFSSNHDYSTDKATVGKSEKRQRAFLEYQCKLSEIKDKWDQLSAFELYDLELRYGMPTSFFTISESKQHKFRISRHPFIEVLETNYDWTEEPTIQAIEDDEKNILIACIPALFYNGYKEMLLDDLECNILLTIETDLPIDDIIERLVPCFPSSGNERHDKRIIRELLLMKLKKLLQYKLIAIH